MALSDDEILSAWAGRDERFMRPILGENKILAFARAIEAEVHKQDNALILMLVERLERADKISGYPNNKAAIAAARARL